MAPGRNFQHNGSGSARKNRDAQKAAQNNKKRRQTLAAGSMPNSVAMFDDDGAADNIENRMLVSVRTRPLSKNEVNRGERQVVTSYCVDKVVRINKAGRKGAVLRSEMGAMHEYQFDHIFGNKATQEDIYLSTTKGIVRETLLGKNCTVFAYGATGAGKTHTMMGTDEDPGIIPRALVDVFEGITKRQQDFSQTANEMETCNWSVKLSYLEVYNETIYDLLTNKQKPLVPCEDPTDFRVKVLGLTETVVTNTSQVLELLRQGNCRRRMESTAANQVSSRSHAVMQVNVECVREQHLVPLQPGRRRLPNEQGLRTVTSSTLSLIDLAGSERAAATHNRGARLREGANINKSLLALANCINALSSSSKSGARVKYRDSKLTHLLKSSLEGNCLLSMIAAINPSHKFYEESHNTLKYANRAKNIKIKASAASNRRNDAAMSEEAMRVEALEAENQELRERLSLNASYDKVNLSTNSGHASTVSEADISLEQMTIRSAHNSSIMIMEEDDSNVIGDNNNGPVSSLSFSSPARQLQFEQLLSKVKSLECANGKLIATVESHSKKLQEQSNTITRQRQHIMELEGKHERSAQARMFDINNNNAEPKENQYRKSNRAAEYGFTSPDMQQNAASDVGFAMNAAILHPPPTQQQGGKKKKKGNRRESFIPRPSGAPKSKKRLSTDLIDDGLLEGSGAPTKQPKISKCSYPSIYTDETNSSPLPEHMCKEDAASSSTDYLSPFQRFTRRMRKHR